jgi:hypothetical protein
LDRLSDAALQRIIVRADSDRLATAAAPCIVNVLRRELAKHGVPQSVTACVVAKLDKPPYDAIRRLFAGANADRLFRPILQACLFG